MRDLIAYLYSEKEVLIYELLATQHDPYLSNIYT
jgi:hypothetical protein